MDAEGSPEIAYYRSVEDLFSSLRGVPHVLSPRDFQLLRRWWREGVPFSAVAAGLNEVFARQREREDADPVVSLGYCRHAVKRHAKRIAEMHVGRIGDERPPVSEGEDLQRIVGDLTTASRTMSGDRPAVAKILAEIAGQIELAATEVPAELLDEHLFGLEATMLRACWRALNEGERLEIDLRVDSAVAATSVSNASGRRSARALRDREVRLLLHLPRLELGG
jgi:hypothetical protein